MSMDLFLISFIVGFILGAVRYVRRKAPKMNTNPPLAVEIAREQCLLDLARGTHTPNPFVRGTMERELFARAYYNERRDFSAVTDALKRTA